MKKRRSGKTGKSIYSSSHGNLPPLGTAEKAVMGLLHQGITSTRQIASRRGCSKRRVNQIFTSLRSKGYIGVAIPTLPKTEQTQEEQAAPLERHNIHALRLRVHVHWMSDKYKAAPNQFYEEFHGVEVDCHHKYILIRSKGQRFYGATPEKALWNSISFWKSLLKRLENRLGVIVLKQGCKVFDVLYAEWEEGDATEAFDAESRGERWLIFDDEDGKLRVTTDHSFSPSLEFHHAKKGYSDRTTWTKNVNAILRNPEAPTLPELAKVMGLHLELNRETAAGVSALAKYMESQLPKKDEAPMMPEGWRPDYVG